MQARCPKRLEEEGDVKVCRGKDTGIQNVTGQEGFQFWLWVIAFTDEDVVSKEISSAATELQSISATELSIRQGDL